MSTKIASLWVESNKSACREGGKRKFVNVNVEISPFNMARKVYTSLGRSYRKVVYFHKE